MLHRYLLFVAVLCGLASCEKAEEAIVLPPPGAAKPGSAEMGANYEKQVYFDFDSGQAIFSGNIDDWDFAFEASRTGRHVFQNGGRGVYVYNTHERDIQKVNALPSHLSAGSDTGWKYDNPNGLSAGTAIGDWDSNGTTKGEVYIVRRDSELRKMRVLAGDDNGYTIEWMPLYGSGSPTQVQISKDTSCNYVYFSFTKGITRIEPPSKTSWDIVFLQYRELVYEGTLKRAIPYIVSGALLNPYQTAAAADSTDDFSAIDFAKAQTLALSINRNTIGYDWKSFGLGSTGVYTVNTHKNYILQTQKGHLYKLHFRDFYRQKGTPLFEYERLK